MSDTRGSQRPSGRALIASFAAVVLIFTISTAAEQIFSSEIRSAAEEITGNSSPSVASLSAVEVGLRRLEVAAMDEVEACHHGACEQGVAPVEDLRRAVHESWNGYRQLPAFPGEAERWPRIDHDLSHLDDQLTLALAAAREGRAARAHALVVGGLEPAFDQLDHGLTELSAFDRQQGFDIAARIGRLARLSIRTSILLDALSVALSVLAAAIAIRAVRRFERSLRERSEDLDRFAGRVAHDIMSPLASTSAAFHLLERHGPEAGKSVIATGQRSLRRVQQLVNDLLELARSGAPPSDAASADVRETVEDVVTELGSMAAELGVALRVDECGGTVACTVGVLSSITSNLVRNAVAYTSESPVKNVVVRARALPLSRSVRVEVEDTGPGIPREVGDAVFEPFVRGTTSTQPGSGLGLATAKRFVEAHGGRIGYSSTPGAGTVFWFEMPSR